VSDSYKTINYNTPEVGGTLDPAHYADYADVLADYVLGYKAKMGVDLTVLSLQTNRISSARMNRLTGRPPNSIHFSEL